MIHGYAEAYLNDVMDHLGSMMEYATYDLRIPSDTFFNLFLNSGIAAEIERGNPKYTVGMSGVELAQTVFFKAYGRWEYKQQTLVIDKSPEYWAAWTLANFQWASGHSFQTINAAIPFSNIIALYPTLHEADIRKAEDVLQQRFGAFQTKASNRLAKIRKERGFTQQGLATASGVTLRMIQLYEQGRSNLQKAQGNTLMALATALGVNLDYFYQ